MVSRTVLSTSGQHLEDRHPPVGALDDVAVRLRQGTEPQFGQMDLLFAADARNIERQMVHPGLVCAAIMPTFAADFGTCLMNIK